MFDDALTEDKTGYIIFATTENTAHIIISDRSNSDFDSTVHLYIGKTGTKM
jgi:hypothetical protein